MSEERRYFVWPGDNKVRQPQFRDTIMIRKELTEEGVAKMAKEHEEMMKNAKPLPDWMVAKREKGAPTKVPTFNFGPPKKSQSQPEGQQGPSFVFCPPKMEQSQEVKQTPSFVFGPPKKSQSQPEGQQGPSFVFGPPKKEQSQPEPQMKVEEDIENTIFRPRQKRPQPAVMTGVDGSGNTNLFGRHNHSSAFKPLSVDTTSGNYARAPGGSSLLKVAKKDEDEDDGWSLDKKDLEAVRPQSMGSRRWKQRLYDAIHSDHTDRVASRHADFQSGFESELFLYFDTAELGHQDFEETLASMKDIVAGGGVKKAIMVEGRGDFPKSTSQVWMHYVTYTEGKEIPMDSSLSRLSPGTYQLGNGEMILGIELAVESMRIGEISKFIMTPEYAYGKLGCPGLVPPNCRILIAIELIKASQKTPGKSIIDMTLAERESLSFQRLYDCADDLRLQGNRKIEFERYYDSIERYEKAVEILESIDMSNVVEKQRNERYDLEFKLYCNIALCHLRVDEPAQAIVACREALGPKMPRPRDAKVYFRHAEASVRLHRYGEANEFIELALTLDPENVDFRLFHRNVQGKLKKGDDSLHELYKRMAACLINDGKPQPDKRDR